MQNARVKSALSGLMLDSRQGKTKQDFPLPENTLQDVQSLSVLEPEGRPGQREGRHRTRSLLPGEALEIQRQEKEEDHHQEDAERRGSVQQLLERR